MASKHLKPTTNPQDGFSATDVRVDVDVPALLAHKREVCKRGFGAGYDHQVGVDGAGLTGLNINQIHLWLGRQRVEIIEVGDAPDPQDCDLESDKLLSFLRSLLT